VLAIDLKFTPPQKFSTESMLIVNKPKLGFICLGPQRTASSWLQEVLYQHDAICFPQGVKETMFFDHRYLNGIDWYNSHFSNAKAGKVCGEIAPTYFDSAEATERIAKHFPTLKFVILARNPVDRVHSLYRHHLSKGRIRCGFDEALDRFPFLVHSGKYSLHCPRWESKFGHQQFLYLSQDQVSISPQVVLDQVCDFLCIKRITLPAIGREKVNSASAPRSLMLARAFSFTSTAMRSFRLYGIVNLAKRMGLKSVFSGGRQVEPMSDNCRRQLESEFLQDTKWLENRLGWDLSSWRPNSGKTSGPDSFENLGELSRRLTDECS